MFRLVRAGRVPGLENRFGGDPDVGSNPTPSASEQQEGLALGCFPTAVPSLQPELAARYGVLVRSMSTADEMARLLTCGGPVLLDFDGPVCSIFARYQAPVIARELVDLIQRQGVALPGTVANEPDPLEVLRWAGRDTTANLTIAVEDALCAAELEAAKTAEPTPFGREVIVAAYQIGRPVAVVSNNSAVAIAAYLAAHRLAGHVASVVGRAYADPARMKPNPEPILSAARALASDPGDCILIGDSLSDVDCARVAGVPVIGYANKSPKAERLRSAGADAVVTSMGDIAAALLLSGRADGPDSSSGRLPSGKCVATDG